MSSLGNSYGPWPTSKRIEDQIHIHSSGDISTIRQMLIDDIYNGGSSGGSLPSEIGTLATKTDPLSLTGTSACKDITMTTYTTYKNTKPTVWYPTSPNGDLMIVHQGHSGGMTSYNFDATVQLYINNNFTVMGFFMPGGADYETSGTSSWHNTNQISLEQYLGPIHIAIDTMVDDMSPTNIYFTGLSGGGWTTHMAAALDTRIDISFPTAGNLPADRYSQAEPTNGLYEGGRDWEQLLPGVRVGLSYFDIYLLASLPSRQQLQILHDEDDCCFYESLYNSALPYASIVASAATALGGTFECRYVAKVHHEFDTTIITNNILPVIT